MREKPSLEPEQKSRTDRKMNDDEYDVFIVELMRKRLLSAFETAGDSDPSKFQRALEFLNRWIEILNRREKADTDYEYQEIEIDEEHLLEDYPGEFAWVNDFLDKAESREFHTRLEEIEDNSERLESILEEHFDRYGYTSRTLSPVNSMQLWRIFGNDERIRPFVQDSFSNPVTVLELTKEGLSREEVEKILNWMRENK